MEKLVELTKANTPGVRGYEVILVNSMSMLE